MLDPDNILALTLATNNDLSKIISNNWLKIKLFLDNSKLVIGKDLATTPGRVVFKNDLLELICYLPTSKIVFKCPILLVPACINKYYILDLSVNNSLIKWLTQQGFVVYVISWVNPQPGSKAVNFSFKNYLVNGVVKAIDIITNNYNTPKLHVAGYCLGGTLLAGAVAYLQQLSDHRILSLTNFMTLLDFNNLGKLNMLLTKPVIKLAKDLMRQQGFLDGRILSMLFSWLQPQNLMIPNVNSDSLLSKIAFNSLSSPLSPQTPTSLNADSILAKILASLNSAAPLSETLKDLNTASPSPLYLPDLDFRYWNSDPVNLPGKMYSYYLQNICLQNKLAKPNGLKLNKIPLDLSKIKLPIFSVAGSKDYITTWPAVYQGARLYGGNVEFILVEAGHVKGIINPPNKHKYSFKFNQAMQHLPEDPALWLQTASTNPGSWWPYWLNWLKNLDNSKIKTLQFNKIRFNSELGDAPGSYVVGNN